MAVGPWALALRPSPPHIRPGGTNTNVSVASIRAGSRAGEGTRHAPVNLDEGEPIGNLDVPDVLALDPTAPAHDCHHALRRGACGRTVGDFEERELPR